VFENKPNGSNWSYVLRLANAAQPERYELSVSTGTSYSSMWKTPIPPIYQTWTHP
jgi:hypothetical protein